MAVQIQLRRDTAANWTAANPTLASGEVGLETDTRDLKIGDGVTSWNSLQYFLSEGVLSGIVAAENIPAFISVTSTGRKGDSSNTSQIGKVVGINLAAISTGFSGQVVTAGEVTNPAWAWTAGDKIYVGIAALTNASPGSGYVQTLGTAKTATTIIIEIGPPVLI